MKPDKRRESVREELGDILKEAKQLATTFDDGRGIPVVSPWQVNRHSRDNAEKSGYYSSSMALSDTAESVNSSDIVISLLAPSDNEQRECQVLCQILKQRDGLTANSILLNVDYATCTFTEEKRSSGMDDILSTSYTDGDTDSDFGGLLG